MKKLFFLLLFVAVVIGLTLNATTSEACCTYPDGTFNGDSNDCSDYVAPTPEPTVFAPVSGGGFCLDCMYPSIKNQMVRTEGNIVFVTWRTTNKMTGSVYIYGENWSDTVKGEDAVGHNITFPITENGVYDIIVQSEYKGKIYTRDVGTINITSNKNIGTDYSVELDGINFHPSLLTEQIEDLLELLEKEIWNDTDHANWNHATRA